MTAATEPKHETALTDEQAIQIVSRFGFTARQVTKGFFIAPVTRNRFSHRHVGDDQMLVETDGNIVPYIDDAQAFLAASALRAVIVGAAGK